MNELFIKGRLTRDVELKYTQNNKPFLKGSIAHNTKYNNVEQSHFFDFTCWSTKSNEISDKLKKGRLILIKGSIEQQRWEKDGKTNSKVSIKCFDIQLIENMYKQNDQDIPF